MAEPHGRHARPIDYFKMFYCPYEPESGIYVRETFRVMRQLGLPEADLAKICHGNALRLMPALGRRA
jgi:hypothetical protein